MNEVPSQQNNSRPYDHRAFELPRPGRRVGRGGAGRAARKETPAGGTWGASGAAQRRVSNGRPAVLIAIVAAAAAATAAVVVGQGPAPLLPVVRSGSNVLRNAIKEINCVAYGISVYNFLTSWCELHINLDHSFTLYNECFFERKTSAYSVWFCNNTIPIWLSQVCDQCTLYIAYLDFP